MNADTKVTFSLGPVVATPGALEALQRNNTDGREYLRRHASGDWGIVCEEDSQLNEHAVQNGSRILSAYLLPDGRAGDYMASLNVYGRHGMDCNQCGTPVTSTVLRGRTTHWCTGCQK